MNDELKEQAERIEAEYGAPGLAAGIMTEMSSMNSFEKLGFEERADGSYGAHGCRVNFYSCFGVYEVNITLPNGKGLCFDVPPGVVAAALEHANPNFSLSLT